MANFEGIAAILEFSHKILEFCHALFAAICGPQKSDRGKFVYYFMSAISHVTLIFF